MAFTVRNVPGAVLAALVAAHNARQEAAVAAFFHADITQRTSNSGPPPSLPTVANNTIASANASDLATSVTLVNEAKLRINTHFADTQAHNTAVSAQVATAAATDLATAITLANALKAAYNTHLAAANVHFNNDGTNATAAADATDLASLQTLLNELKGDFNAHLISAPIGSMINLITP